ncbi:hypothetical protein CEXT_534511 [Caerostris extrusa]|uniref:Uncharacterized protein n=1 Tax=Caerostris extrusa TaxID=172846 RepID=A0AAV4Y0T0_CAEEX|nr:hypothetical protein CEXT_534511 [Caerostris extrusa]
MAQTLQSKIPNNNFVMQHVGVHGELNLLNELGYLSRETAEEEKKKNGKPSPSTVWEMTRQRNGNRNGELAYLGESGGKQAIFDTVFVLRDRKVTSRLTPLRLRGKPIRPQLCVGSPGQKVGLADRKLIFTVFELLRFGDDVTGHVSVSEGRETVMRACRS